MSSKKGDKEISVKAPYLPSTKEPEIIKDTVEAERIRFLTIAKRVGESMSGLMLTVSALTLFLSLQFLLDPLLSIPGLPSVKSLLTAELILITAGIVGVINIICGFVMLAKE